MPIETIAFGGDFTISVDSAKLLVASVRQAKYLGLWVRNDHILELSRKCIIFLSYFAV